MAPTSFPTLCTPGGAKRRELTLADRLLTWRIRFLWPLGRIIPSLRDLTGRNSVNRPWRSEVQEGFAGLHFLEKLWGFLGFSSSSSSRALPGASLIAQLVKNLAAMWETQV